MQIPNAQETLWHCRNVDLKNVRADRADYLFLHGENIRIGGLRAERELFFPILP